MHTKVIFIQTDSSFTPNLFALFIRENGSMKDEVYNLTLLNLNLSAAVTIHWSLSYFDES